MSRIDFSFEGKDGLTLDDITYTLIGLKLKGTFNTIDGTTAVVEDAPALALSQKVMAGEYADFIDCISSKSFRGYF